MIVLIAFIAVIVLILHSKFFACDPDVIDSVAVNCGRVAPLPKGVDKSKKIPKPLVTVFSDDETLSAEDIFCGYSCGPSMEHEGIPDGSEFAGRILFGKYDDKKILKLLDVNALVVFKGEDGPEGTTPYRLRKIKEIIENDDVTKSVIKIHDYHDDTPHKDRSIAEVYALVTHVRKDVR